jgi:hypothetical protein
MSRASELGLIETTEPAGDVTGQPSAALTVVDPETRSRSSYGALDRRRAIAVLLRAAIAKTSARRQASETGWQGRNAEIGSAPPPGRLPLDRKVDGTRRNRSHVGCVTCHPSDGDPGVAGAL